jgi:hypothetical protein
MKGGYSDETDDSFHTMVCNRSAFNLLRVRGPRQNFSALTFLFQGNLRDDIEQGGVNIKNIKAFRQDLPDKQDIKNQSFKRSCQSCYPV